MIFITSYPYIGERHIRVFDFFRKKDDLVFILPEIWKMKGGKVVLKTEPRPGLKIISTPTSFFHSRYPIIRGHLKGWMPATKKILKKMAKPGDVLFTVSEPNLLVTYLNARLAKKMGLKHIFFTWQNIPYSQRLKGLKLKFTEWMIRKNIKLSWGAICGNSKSLDILKPYLPEGFKALVSPVSGVDTERFRPDLQSDFREKNNLQNKIIITFAGAFDNRKGIFTLLKAFSVARESEPRLHLVIIGAGPLEAEIKDFISQDELHGAISLFGWFANYDLPKVFASSDIFAYPSEPYGGWEEQFGFSIAEALASGLPVISTRSGSIEDIVSKDKNGILIEPGNISELVTAIGRLAKNPALRKRMGNAGRGFIAQNFSHQKIAEKLENFLRNI